jgi:hypothetical protein
MAQLIPNNKRIVRYYIPQALEEIVRNYGDTTECIEHRKFKNDALRGKIQSMLQISMCNAPEPGVTLSREETYVAFLALVIPASREVELEFFAEELRKKQEKQVACICNDYFQEYRRIYDQIVRESDVQFAVFEKARVAYSAYIQMYKGTMDVLKQGLQTLAKQ